MGRRPHPRGPPRADAPLMGTRPALRRSQAQHDQAPCPQRRPDRRDQRRVELSGRQTRTSTGGSRPTCHLVPRSLMETLHGDSAAGHRCRDWLGRTAAAGLPGPAGRELTGPTLSLSKHAAASARTAAWPRGARLSLVGGRARSGSRLASTAAAPGGSSSLLRGTRPLLAARSSRLINPLVSDGYSRQAAVVVVT